MITSLEFNNFRGFKDFKISPAKSINLIAGANNTGKTGILEGLLLLCTSRERVSEDVADLPGRFRSNVYGKNSGFSGAQTDDFFTFWQALFYDKDLELAPCIAARVNHRADIAGCVLLGDKSGDIIWIKHFPPNMH